MNTPELMTKEEVKSNRSRLMDFPRNVWKSVFRIMKGALVGWGKLDRTASVGKKP